MNPKAYRLPVSTRPRHYDIELDARLGTERFSGRVAIEVTIAEMASTLDLHARDLEITEARCSVAGRDLAATVMVDAEREIIRLSFPQPLPVGAATLSMRFGGRLNPGLQGLYLAADGPEHMISTQCEATEARAIFPCFDEPTFKARFAVKIRTAAGQTVLANGRLLSTSDDGDSRIWTFAPTKPMSTYLFALVIGDISSTPEAQVAGTPIRVWALTGKERLGTFAQGYTERLLPWYESYFGVPYHFDKYDQVAVPGFAAGAMENCGLVLFRQTALLLAPETTGWRDEKGIAHVIAHEFAHMWFGNYVTMRWWDDLWLNEAFAEWVSLKAVDELSPDYGMWDEFQAAKNAALRTDALKSTHPIYQPVATPAEAGDLFDLITYQKGCAVLRMLEHVLGADAFRAGLRTYMREFGENNAAGADLWNHLQQASATPVTAMMQSWITQPGFPIISVSYEQQGDSHLLHCRQERFFSEPGRRDETGQSWHVPLVIRYVDDTGSHELRAIFADATTTVTLPLRGKLQLAYANAEQIGFYRQHLDPQLLAMVRSGWSALTTSEQTGLLDDQWALTRNGSLSIDDFLDILDAAATTDNYLVIDAVVGYLLSLDDLVRDAADTDAGAHFRHWIATTFRPRLAALGFVPAAGEDQNRALQRVAVVQAMTRLAEDEAAVREAVVWADREAADASTVDANLAPVVIEAAARVGDSTRFRRFVELYQGRRAAQATPQETDRYLYSFAGFQQPELVQSTLDLLDERVLPQEALIPLLAQMLRRKHSQIAAWSYLKNNWQVVKETGSLAVGAVVVATGQLPAQLRDDIVAFFDKHLDGAAQQSYNRALETLDQLAEFKTRTQADLVSWLKRR